MRFCASTWARLGIAVSAAIPTAAIVKRTVSRRFIGHLPRELTSLFSLCLFRRTTGGSSCGAPHAHAWRLGTEPTVIVKIAGVNSVPKRLEYRMLTRLRKKTS